MSTIDDEIGRFLTEWCPLQAGARQRASEQLRDLVRRASTPAPAPAWTPLADRVRARLDGDGLSYRFGSATAPPPSAPAPTGSAPPKAWHDIESMRAMLEKAIRGACIEVGCGEPSQAGSGYCAGHGFASAPSSTPTRSAPVIVLDGDSVPDLLLTGRVEIGPENDVHTVVLADSGRAALQRAAGGAPTPNVTAACLPGCKSWEGLPCDCSPAPAGSARPTTWFRAVDTSAGGDLADRMAQLFADVRSIVNAIKGRTPADGRAIDAKITEIEGAVRELAFSRSSSAPTGSDFLPNVGPDCAPTGGAPLVEHFRAVALVLVGFANVRRPEVRAAINALAAIEAVVTGSAPVTVRGAILAIDGDGDGSIAWGPCGVVASGLPLPAGSQKGDEVEIAISKVRP